MATCVLQIAPVSKPRMTRADRWKKRQSVLKFFAFRDAVRQYCETHAIGWWSFEIEFHVPMPKVGLKRKRNYMMANLTIKHPTWTTFLKHGKILCLKKTQLYGEFMHVNYGLLVLVI